MVKSTNSIKKISGVIPNLLFQIANLIGDKNTHEFVLLKSEKAIYISILRGAFIYARGPQEHIRLHCTDAALRVFQKNINF